MIHLYFLFLLTFNKLCVQGRKHDSYKKTANWRNPCSFKQDGIQRFLKLNTTFTFSVDMNLTKAFKSMFGDYFGDRPCSRLKLKFEKDGETHVVDDPMGHLSSDVVSEEPMVKFEGVDISQQYELIMIDYENFE